MIELCPPAAQPPRIEHDGRAIIAERTHRIRTWRLAARGAAIVLCASLAVVAWPQQPAFAQNAPAPAQGTPVQAGSISGSVTDRDGTVYEGAQATLTASGQVGVPARTQVTDSSGRFSFTSLSAGAYTLAISSKGFATETRTIVLGEGQNYEAKPIVLPVSSTTEVRVSANSTPIEIAREEVRLEEHQRVLGIIPNFFVAYDPKAPPLTVRLKFELAWKASIDPVDFLGAGALAGLEQADNYFSGYGQGAQGYGKRYGAAFADSFFGSMFGNGIYPALLRQDPRYFYQGTGTIRSRAFHAIVSAVVCKGDNGRWQPNFSGILGSLTSGGISNLYYPAANRNGLSLTFENTGLGTAGSAVQALLQEFVVRKLTPKLPNYGSPRH